MGIKDFLMGAVETALDIGASFIPGGSMAKKMAKKAFKGLSRATGMAKDLFAGGDGGLSELTANFGDYRSNVNLSLWSPINCHCYFFRWSVL